MTTFNSSLDMGAKAWCIYGPHAEEFTVGRISVIFTDSKGTDEYLGAIISNGGDNYGVMKDYREEYMCTETGIGAGTVYTYGKHIFKTKAECEAANVDVMAAFKAEQMAAAERRRLSDIDALARARHQVEYLSEKLGM